MNKSTIVALFALAFSSTGSAEENIIGTWKCNMVSEYGEFMFELTLNADKTFVKREDAFGEINIGIGKWVIEGKDLIMKREKYIKHGEEQASSQEFRREIISSSNTVLEMKHGETTTSCTKA